MLSTDRQTDKLTNATKNVTSFAKEVAVWQLCGSQMNGEQFLWNSSVINVGKITSETSILL